MAIGPVQIIVLGFPDHDFHGEIIDEFERLRQSDTVRVIDALAVYKDAAGEIEAMHLSNLTQDEAIELGSVVGALIGLGSMASSNELTVMRAAGRSLVSILWGVLKPVIDTVLPFEHIVEAHRRVDGGHKVGSIVLTFGKDP